MSQSDRVRRVLLGLLAALSFGVANLAMADPPDRVARLSYIRGAVSFTPAGDDRWSEASLNRPLVTGDKLYTERDARAELDLGTAKLRLDNNSSFSFLNLDDKTAQIELTSGTLNLHVRKLYQGQTYEVDTPTVAFVVNEPGEYRIDAGARNDPSQITVFNGSGTVYGENGTSYRVDDKQSYRFADSSLRNPEVMDLPRPDEFDDWSFARDDRERRSTTHHYVSEDVVGASDLDEYGDWDGVPDYGNVWFPAHVTRDWAPYRSGHWAWIDPWGWTWVDNEPWGFAPFHYGRWVYVSDRWGWLPGPVEVRPVYAPALVAFVGGRNWSIGISLGDSPVGWCPLGPRDVYVPPYRVSRDYFNQVNVSNTTIINNTHITNIYNNYAAGQAPTGANYTYRDNPAAVTAVSRDTFAHARPVADRRLHFGPGQLRRAQVLPAVAVAPTAASLMPASAHATARPPADAFNRRVIARGTPAPPAPPMATRLRAIEHNNGRPLGNRQLRQLAEHNRADTPSNVRVLDPKQARPPVPLTATTAAQARNANAPEHAQLFERDRGRGPNATYPSQRQQARHDPRAPTARVATSPRESAIMTDQALPSAGFAPHAHRDTPSRAADAPRDNHAMTEPRANRIISEPRDQRDARARPLRRPEAQVPAERANQPLPSSRFYGDGRNVEPARPAAPDNSANVATQPMAALPNDSRDHFPAGASNGRDQRFARADRPRYQRDVPNEAPVAAVPEYRVAPRPMRQEQPDRVPHASMIAPEPPPRAAPEVREAPRTMPPLARPEPPAAAPAPAPREMPAQPAPHEPPPVAASNHAPPAQQERAPQRGKDGRRAREDRHGDNAPPQ
ncbi:MAG: DUF6600 domain-containing protein [Gammaproteobacteria bacterium]